MYIYSRTLIPTVSFFFFFNDTATTEIYTLSLHDALPICAERRLGEAVACHVGEGELAQVAQALGQQEDRKSTRLNSSHLVISYAVFCLKKKKKKTNQVLDLRTTLQTQVS